MLPVLGHDELDRVLALFQGGPQLLVLLLELADVAVLLLDAWERRHGLSGLLQSRNRKQ